MESKTEMDSAASAKYGVFDSKSWLNVPHINLCIRPFLSWSLKANVLGYENDFAPSISEDNFNDSSSLQNYDPVWEPKISVKTKSFI